MNLSKNAKLVGPAKRIEPLLLFGGFEVRWLDIREDECPILVDIGVDLLISIRDRSEEVGK